MTITKIEVKRKDVLDLMDELQKRKDKIEAQPGYLEDLPSPYVGAAIYSYIIDELKGLIE